MAPRNFSFESFAYMSKDEQNFQPRCTRRVMIREIEISTTLQPYEDLDKVIESVKSLFPDWSPEITNRESDFPSKSNPEIIYGTSSSMDYFLEAIRNQSILDTALDAMTMEEDDQICDFTISRLASLAGKVSFTLGERVIGGSIDISITGVGLIEWLESATWHEGRREIPRGVGDELSMYKDGSPREWFD